MAVAEAAEAAAGVQELMVRWLLFPTVEVVVAAAAVAGVQKLLAAVAGGQTILQREGGQTILQREGVALIVIAQLLVTQGERGGPIMGSFQKKKTKKQKVKKDRTYLSLFVGLTLTLLL